MGPIRIPNLFATAALAAAIVAMPAFADPAEQAALDCLQGNMAAFEIIDPSEITQAEGGQLAFALEDLMASGLAVSQGGPAADWTIEQAVIAMFGQQAEAVRTGAVEGRLLRNPAGLVIQWEDQTVGTLCLVPVPAGEAPARAGGDPVISEAAIGWRTDASDAASAHVAQIIIVSDIPG